MVIIIIVIIINGLLSRAVSILCNEQQSGIDISVD